MTEPYAQLFESSSDGFPEFSLELIVVNGTSSRPLRFVLQRNKQIVFIFIRSS